MADKNKQSVAGQIASRLIDPGKQIRQFTRISKFQAELFSLLDVIIAGRKYILEVAAYNTSPKAYAKVMKKDNPEHTGMPVIPNLAEDLLLSIAGWNRSIVGEGNFTQMTSELALEDIRASSGEEDFMKKFDYGDEEE